MLSSCAWHVHGVSQRQNGSPSAIEGSAGQTQTGLSPSVMLQYRFASSEEPVHAFLALR